MLTTNTRGDTLNPNPRPPKWDTLLFLAGGAIGGSLTHLLHRTPDCLGYYADLAAHSILGATIGVLVPILTLHLWSRRKGGRP